MRQLKTQLEWLAQDHTASKQSQDQNLVLSCFSYTIYHSCDLGVMTNNLFGSVLFEKSFYIEFSITFSKRENPAQREAGSFSYMQTEG